MTLASAAVLAIGLAVLTLGIALVLSHQADVDASTRLGERADALLATLDERGGRLIVRDIGDDEALDAQAWVFALDGRVVERPRARGDIQRAAQSLAGVNRDTERNVGKLRLRADPAFLGKARRRVGTVVVGVSLGPAERTRHVALLAIAGLDLFVLFFGALLARAAVANALRPVADMTARAADWSEHDLDRRFALGPPHDELTALSATLDGLLARIAASMRHEQRFSAELAHELRTPLTGVRAEAELALRDPALAAGSRAAFEQILASAQRMGGIIDTLLSAARADAKVAGDAATDIHDVIVAACVEFTPTARAAGIVLDVQRRPDSGPLRVGVEAALAGRALSPLLDNAVRHAHSRVSIDARRDGEIVITVSDDGPGIDAADAELIFTPGHSGSDSGAGAGLGLGLARRLARSGGGDVIAPVTLAGTGGRVQLRLPALDA